MQRRIRRRQNSTFYKYKNTIRIVNWLLKFRKLKSLKNPFQRFRRGRHYSKINKLKGKGKNKNALNYKYKKQNSLITNVKRV